MPEQISGSNGIRSKLTAAGLPQLSPAYRLAGTFRSVVFEEVDLEAEIPAKDGVHLFFDLECDWIRLAVFYRIAAHVVQERAEDMIQNEPAALLPVLLSQIKIAPAGWELS